MSYSMCTATLEAHVAARGRAQASAQCHTLAMQGWLQTADMSCPIHLHMRHHGHCLRHLEMRKERLYDAQEAAAGRIYCMHFTHCPCWSRRHHACSPATCQTQVRTALKHSLVVEDADGVRHQCATLQVCMRCSGSASATGCSRSPCARLGAICAHAARRSHAEASKKASQLGTQSLESYKKATRTTKSVQRPSVMLQRQRGSDICADLLWARACIRTD